MSKVEADREAIVAELKKFVFDEKQISRINNISIKDDKEAKQFIALVRDVVHQNGLLIFDNYIDLDNLGAAACLAFCTLLFKKRIWLQQNPPVVDMFFLGLGWFIGFLAVWVGRKARLFREQKTIEGVKKIYNLLPNKSNYAQMPALVQWHHAKIQQEIIEMFAATFGERKSVQSLKKHLLTGNGSKMNAQRMVCFLNEAKALVPSFLQHQNDYSKVIVTAEIFYTISVLVLSEHVRKEQIYTRVFMYVFSALSCYLINKYWVLGKRKDVEAIGWSSRQIHRLMSTLHKDYIENIAEFSELKTQEAQEEKKVTTKKVSILSERPVPASRMMARAKAKRQRHAEPKTTNCQECLMRGVSRLLSGAANMAGWGYQNTAICMQALLTNISLLRKSFVVTVPETKTIHKELSRPARAKKKKNSQRTNESNDAIVALEQNEGQISCADYENEQTAASSFSVSTVIEVSESKLTPALLTLSVIDSVTSSNVITAVEPSHSTLLGSATPTINEVEQKTASSSSVSTVMAASESSLSQASLTLSVVDSATLTIGENKQMAASSSSVTTVIEPSRSSFAASALFPTTAVLTSSIESKKQTVLPPEEEVQVLMVTIKHLSNTANKRIYELEEEKMKVKVLKEELEKSKKEQERLYGRLWSKLPVNSTQKRGRGRGRSRGRSQLQEPANSAYQNQQW